MGGEIVEDDHRPRFQFRDQDLFDVGVEGVPVHSPRDHPGRHDPIVRQACDQGLVAPSPEGALPLRRSPRRLRPYSRVILVLVPVSSRKISR